MASAAAQPVAIVTIGGGDTPKVALLFHRPFVAPWSHPRAVHHRALVDALCVQKVQFALGQLRHFPFPSDPIAIAGCGTMGFQMDTESPAGLGRNGDLYLWAIASPADVQQFVAF